MRYSAERLKESIKKNGITNVPLFNCFSCEYPVHFYIDENEKPHLNICSCKSPGSHIDHDWDWELIATWLNSVGEESLAEYLPRFGIKKED